MDRKLSNRNHKSSSKELLSIQGDGSSRAVVEHLFRKQPKASSGDRPKTFKIARSPLLDQLQSFLPHFEKSTNQLLAKSDEEKEAFRIENTETDDKVVEMNIVVGEMADSNSDSEVSTDDKDTNDSEDDMPVVGHINEMNIKIPSATNKTKKLIRVLGDQNEEESDGTTSDGASTVASSSSAER
ncbi:hypothetical protein SK128_019003 [Halocaridina rubra]|uniref:Uncharacterized protein n=1 Tax=Halocaridina rubra TaxID=373956 RepID=A0AAN8WCD1_HALRR